MVRILRIHRSVASRSVEAIRKLIRVCVIFTKWIPGDQHGKRSPGLNRQDTIGFPVAENRLRDCSKRFRRGNIPYVIGREVMPLVLVGESAPASFTEPKQC